eukprot:TRINITY_DN10031_c0_g1_i1.p1 TRINITY_DN10031_c0_g1~~TRINITY_DN10031_c0_g1_i1.p1  ORF type:complete len:124 (+),score=28.81 TRINITY_DN10031_c0_g1_i1:439-810(+)
MLIADIADLGTYAEIIKMLIKETGKIPGDVFSICLDLYNVTYTPDPAAKTERISACAQLDSTIMCWKGKCEYKGTDKFGCFDVVVPTGVTFQHIDDGDDDISDDVDDEEKSKKDYPNAESNLS